MIYNLQPMTDKLSFSIKTTFDTVFPWLISGIALVGAIMIMTPRTAVMEISDEAWLNNSADGVSGQPRLPVETSGPVSRIEDSGGNPAQDFESAQPPVDSVSARNIDSTGDSTGFDTIRSSATEQQSDAPRQSGTTSGDLSPAESLPLPDAGPDKASTSNIQKTEASSKSVDTAGAATVAIKEPDDPAAGSDDTAGAATAAKKAPDAPAAGSDDTPGAATVALNEPAPPAAGTKPRETIRNTGPWVINLASSRSRDNAERFKARAGNRGIVAVLHRVTVKGTEYWRVQVPGFATADEAKAEVDVIKKKLGLDDVWVVKR